MSDKALRRVKAIDEDSGVPTCIYWDTKTIAAWIEEVGYPQYKECFVSNGICGRHLIYLDASSLPKMGITDFEDIKHLSAHIRAELNLRSPIKNMNVAMSDPMVAYMELKRRTGRLTQNMSYRSFLCKHRRWFP